MTFTIDQIEHWVTHPAELLEREQVGTIAGFNTTGMIAKFDMLEAMTIGDTFKQIANYVHDVPRAVEAYVCVNDIHAVNRVAGRVICKRGHQHWAPWGDFEFVPNWYWQSLLRAERGE